MKMLLAASLSLLCLSAAPARAQDAEKIDARIASANGDVVVRPADGSPEVSAEADMPLEQGDVVVAAEGGSAEIAIDGASLVTVREGSELKIEKTDKADSSFFLQAGSLLAKIQKLGERRFAVRTPAAVAAVRGTEFGVEVEGEDSHVGVFDEGKVEVTGQGGGPAETLISNQETSVAKGKAPEHAAQLKRFVARRAAMRAHGRRLAAIKAKWRALPAADRREFRRKALERMRAHRLKMLEKMKDRKSKRDEKKAQREERQKQRMQENRRKMEEQRAKFRNGRGNR